MEVDIHEGPEAGVGKDVYAGNESMSSSGMHPSGLLSSSQPHLLYTWTLCAGYRWKMWE